MNIPFQSLITLIATDRALQELMAQEAELIMQRQQLQKQQEELDHKWQSAVRAVYDAQKEVNVQERAIKVLQDAERDKRLQFDRVVHYKEYQSLKAELEALAREQYASEENLLGAWQHLEHAHKDQTALQKKNMQEQERLVQEIARCDDQLGACRTQQEILQITRKQQQREVPEQWLEKYAVMSLRVLDPVVEERDGFCDACSYPITQQEQIRLRNRALVECRNCYRLVYNKNAMERSVTADQPEMS